jgi:hypothetical protein
MITGKTEALLHLFTTQLTNGTSDLSPNNQVKLIQPGFSHWDTWTGPKRPSLFSVRLYKDPSDKWVLDEDFVNILKDTNHVCMWITSQRPLFTRISLFQHTPVEPFGGLDSFDASGMKIVYTAKDPNLPEAWHTKQNVWLAPTNYLS